LPRLAERPFGLLVVVPCGKAKIWARNPQAGPTAAADAYVGAPFIVNRRYAELAGGDWVILSAEHGFLRPADVVPGPYETTFKRQSTNPIGPGALREQVEQLGLGHYGEVIGLGGKEHRAAIEAAFEGTRCGSVSLSPGCLSERRWQPPSRPPKKRPLKRRHP